MLWPVMWELMWPGAACASILMLGAWILARRFRNMGIVDVVWSFSFIPLTVIYASRTVGGEPTRRFLIWTLVSLWSLRLTLHLLARVFATYPKEDARYAKIRRGWEDRRANVAWNSFWLFQFQALLAFVLSLPFALICLNADKDFSRIEHVGIFLWVMALIGESAADKQLARFKADPANKDKTCRFGLWGYSRHPNYFFEWLIWCAYGVLALGSEGGLWGLLAPALMLLLLTKVTGVPWAEEQSLASRGDEYRRYQRQTSVFVPWFKKEK